MRRRTPLLLKSISIGLLCASVCLSAVAGEGGLADEAKSVSDFAVFVPSNPADCDRSNPWAAGRWKLSDSGAVPSGGCLALSFQVVSAVHTVLIHQGPEGVLTRLTPSDCSFDQDDVLPQGEHWFPASRHGRERIIQLDNEAGFERFHLLVLESGAASRALLHQLAAISSLDSSCDIASMGPRDIAELQALVLDGDSAVEWHTQSIEHY